MRPLYVLVVWVVILGGLWFYTTVRNAVERATPTAIEIQPAPGHYELELTPTFDAIGGVDLFALEPTAKPTIVARLNGEEIVRFEQSATSGIPQRFTWDTRQVPVQIGKNELYVELSAPEGDASAFRGVRVRLLRDDAPIADEMLWSQPGAPVQGPVPIEVPAAAMGEHKSEEINHG